MVPSIIPFYFPILFTMWRVCVTTRLWINLIYLPFLVFGIYNMAAIRSQYSECYSSDHPEPDEEPSDPIRFLVVFTNVAVVFIVGLQTFIPYYNVDFTWNTGKMEWWNVQLTLYGSFATWYTIWTPVCLSMNDCKGGRPINILAKFPYEYGWFIFISIFLVTLFLVGIIGLLCVGLYKLCKACCKLYVPKPRHGVSMNTTRNVENGVSISRPQFVNAARNPSVRLPFSGQDTFNNLPVRRDVIGVGLILDGPPTYSRGLGRCSPVIESNPSSSAIAFGEPPPIYDDVCSTTI